MTTPRAPKHLRPATKRWWSIVVESYELEEHHLKLLSLAATAWDRAEEARQELAKSGLTYSDRFGAPRPRPEVAIERDSRLAYCRVLRELDLDSESLRESSRPPLLRRFRGG